MAKRPVIQDGDFSLAAEGVSANRVWFALARTIKTGEYESMRLEYGRGSAIPDGADPEAIQQQVRDDVYQTLLGMVAEVEELLSARPNKRKRS